ncbi:MAG: hypothetical protein L0211_15435 [Planctomycetaceae bacterium]|nr:hypothetical protein [Planctomycetaceae bacterium]
MAKATVESLLEAVQSLPPRDVERFEDRFGEWRRGTATDQHLITVVHRGLRAVDDARLRKLITRSEEGTLSEGEWEEYRSLARKAEQLNLERVRALAELSRRWAQPVEAVMEKIGWKSRANGS